MTLPDGSSLDGLQQIVDRLAAHLGRSVAIDDPQGRLLASSGHFGEEDPMRVWAIIHRYSDPRVMAHFKANDIYALTTPGRVPENRELQMKARIACPIRDHDLLFGHLFLIDDGISEQDLADAVAATVQIGQLMYRRLALHEENQRRAEVLVRQLVSPDQPAQSRAIVAAREEGVLTVTDPVTAVVVRVVESNAGPADLQTDLHAAAELTTRDRYAGAALAWVRSSEIVVLLFGRAAQDGRKVAEQLCSRLLAPDHRVLAGIGAVTDGDAGAAQSFTDAILAVRAAGLFPELGTVVAADTLGFYRLLLSLPTAELSAPRHAPGLQRLLDADSGDGLIETLETYLDCAGDVGRTSAALHIHRSTLYYRLGRIETIAGVDLRDGEQRLSLHLGLKLQRLVSAL